MYLTLGDKNANYDSRTVLQLRFWIEKKILRLSKMLREKYIKTKQNRIK